VLSQATGGGIRSREAFWVALNSYQSATNPVIGLHNASLNFLPSNTCQKYDKITQGNEEKDIRIINHDIRHLTKQTRNLIIQSPLRSVFR
jgi:hypothetical protein